MNKRDKLMFIAVAITFVIFIGSSVFFGFSTSKDSKVIDAQKTQLAQLNNKTDVMQAATNDEDTSAKTTSAGLDSDRVKKDSQAFISFFNDKIASYSSNDEYTSTRSDLVSKYKLQANNGLLTDIMPETEWPCGVTVASLPKLSLSEPEFYITGINGDVYSYLVRSCLNVGNKKQRVTFMVSINGKQEIVKISEFM